MAQRLSWLGHEHEPLLRDDMIFHVLTASGEVASFDLTMRQEMEEALADGNPRAWKYLIEMLDQSVEEEDE